MIRVVFDQRWFTENDCVRTALVCSHGSIAPCLKLSLASRGHCLRHVLPDSQLPHVIYLYLIAFQTFSYHGWTKAPEGFASGHYLRLLPQSIEFRYYPRNYAYASTPSSLPDLSLSISKNDGKTPRRSILQSSRCVGTYDTKSLASDVQDESGPSPLRKLFSRVLILSRFYTRIADVLRSSTMDSKPGYRHAQV